MSSAKQTFINEQKHNSSRVCAQKCSLGRKWLSRLRPNGGSG